MYDVLMYSFSVVAILGFVSFITILLAIVVQVFSDAESLDDSSFPAIINTLILMLAGAIPFVAMAAIRPYV